MCWNRSQARFWSGLCPDSLGMSPPSSGPYPPHLLAKAVSPELPGESEKRGGTQALLVENSVGLEVGPDKDIFKCATGDSTVFPC